MAKHLNENVKLYGDKIGVFNFRLHLSSYLKGFKNSRNLIKELYVLSDKNEILRLIKEFLNE
jgi:tRNA-dihydrouridine synthase